MDEDRSNQFCMTALNSSSLRRELGLAALLAFATGATVGVTKLLQILLTTPGNRFFTTSEAVAEEFIVAFGFSKAVGNLIAGTLSDRYGRRVCMATGWLCGAAFSGLILLCQSWSYVVWCDLLLGLNQALCWSAALFIAHDVLATQRGFASGLVETMGYAAIAIASPVVDALGAGAFDVCHTALLALCVGCAVVTVMAVRETRPGSKSSRGTAHNGGIECTAADSSSNRDGTAVREWPKGSRDEASAVGPARTSCLEPGLMACCLVGLCLNLATAYAWGAMTRWLARHNVGISSSSSRETGGSGLSLGSVLLLYSIPKGVLQLPAGLLADTYLGARALVLSGVLGCASTLATLAAVTAIADAALADVSGAAGASSAMDGAPRPSRVAVSSAASSAFGILAFLLGASTACAYSPVIACVAARARPEHRASAVATYRFWRDLGYSVGALLLGNAADGLSASGSSSSGDWSAPLLAALALVAAAAVFARYYVSSDANFPGETQRRARCRSESRGLAAFDGARFAREVQLSSISTSPSPSTSVSRGVA